MTPICFYHKADLDGVCSGAIVKKFVPDCEMVGFDYGMEFPWDRATHRTVYMVDVSLPDADMHRLADAADLIWIDHHKSAIDALCVPSGPRFKRYHCIVGKAACELCWEFFGGPAESTPEAVRLLGRYDVWDKNNPDWNGLILPFQYGMRSFGDIYDPRSDLWAPAFSGDLQIGPVVGRGDAVLMFQSQQAERVADAGAFDASFFVPTGPAMYGGTQEGYCVRALCLNTPLFSSQSFDSVWDPAKYEVMAPFAKMKDGKWKVSLYSTKPDVDCGAIARTFGGGGHKGAAGFLCSRLPWEAK